MSEYRLFAKRGRPPAPRDVPPGFHWSTYPSTLRIRGLLKECARRDVGNWDYPGGEFFAIGVYFGPMLIAHGARYAGGLLHCVVVHPTFRRKGIGSWLVAQLCPPEPYPFLIAPTDPDTTPEGIAFWQDLGFTEITK